MASNQDQISETQQSYGMYQCYICNQRLIPQDFPSAVKNQYWVRIRPDYPWENWQELSSLSQAAKETCYDRAGMAPLILSKPAPKLNAFLIELERMDEERYPREVNNMIREQVCKEVERLFAELAQRHPENFKDVILHLVGSASEGTKTGLYDEFDFIVELPILSESFEEPYGQRKSIDLYNQLISSLPPCWRTIYDMNFMQESYESAKNILLSLRLPSTSEIVFCDIILASRGVAVSYKCRICSKTPARSDVFIYTCCQDATRFLCFTFHEFDKLFKSVKSDNVGRIYRLAKLMIRDHLPPRCDILRFKSAVESHWLKQIIFFMMDNISEQEFWQEEYLGVRVAQAVSMLYTCVKTNRLVAYNDCMHYKEFPPNTNFWCRYLPVLCELLCKAGTGDDSALTSLKALRRVTLKFKKYVVHDTVWLGLGKITGKYLDVLQDHSPIHKLSDMPLVKTYIDTFLPGEVDILEVNHPSKVVYNNVTYSWKDFEDQILRDYVTIDKAGEKWDNLYSEMYEDCMPASVMAIVEDEKKRRQEMERKEDLKHFDETMKILNLKELNL